MPIATQRRGPTRSPSMGIDSRQTQSGEVKKIDAVVASGR